MEFNAHHEPAHRNYLKPFVSKKRMQVFLVVTAMTAVVAATVSIQTIILNNQQATYFERLMNEPVVDDPLDDVLQVTVAQDPYLHDTDQSIADVVTREETLFAAGSVSGLCTTGIFDDFNQSTTSADGMIANGYDTNKWTVFASPSSTFTTQEGKGIFLATGSLSKNQWGAVITTKKSMLGDVTIKVALNHLPLNTDITGAGSVYRLVLWQTGNNNIGLNLFTDRNNKVYAALSKYDSTVNKSTYFNSVGKELESAASDAKKVTNISSNQDLILTLQRKNTKVTATVTQENSDPVVVGVDNNYNAKPFFMTTSFGVSGQNRTLVADVDNIQLEGCFIE